MLVFGICLVVFAVGCGVWRWLSRRHHRRKALTVLRWIEAAMAGHGDVAGIRWLTPSHFKVPLRLTSRSFRRAWIIVELSPCELPIHWLLSKLKNQQDLLTFHADLDLPPSFSLEVHNFHWFARSSKKVAPGSGHWTLEQSGPLIISTRMNWQKEITHAMTSLTDSCNREFTSIRFQRRSPHFSATVPLAAISPRSPTRACIFDTVREVAANSSASLS